MFTNWTFNQLEIRLNIKLFDNVITKIKPCFLFVKPWLKKIILFVHKWREDSENQTIGKALLLKPKLPVTLRPPGINLFSDLKTFNTPETCLTEIERDEL